MNGMLPKPLKIRAVWQSKAEHGKRVSATVPFGYMKDPNNKGTMVN